MIKIDFLITKMSDGGAQRVISNVANYLNEKEYSIRIITFRNGDHYPINEGIERVRMHNKKIVDSVVLNGLFQLAKFYKKKANRPDIMNSHIDLLGYMTIPIAKLYRIPIVVSEHNNYLSSYKFSERFLWKFLYPKVNAVTILTSFDLGYFSKKNKNVVIMPNPSSFPIKKNIELNKKRSKEILAIGQLNRYHHKGFDNLLKIIKDVTKTHPEWKLKLVGAGDKGAIHLKKMAKELNIEHNVEFTGYRSDIQDLLNQAQIFVLPSRWEGLPMTLLEAMSQGIPCVAFDCVSGPSDIISHEETGLLIEDQNLEAMANGLCRLIDDEELLKKFRISAPGSMEKFSIENVGKQWDELFKKILKNNQE